MFNLRVLGIIAGIAFILSMLLGLLSRTSMPLLLVRPLIFAVVFFVISGIVSFLVNQFLPDLLEVREAEPDAGPDFAVPGSRVDISEGEGFAADFTPSFLGPASPPGKAAYAGARPDDGESELGDISDLLSGKIAPVFPLDTGMDQNPKTAYNESYDQVSEAPSQGQQPQPSPQQFKPSFTGSFSDFGGGDSVSTLEMLPDLDSMAGAFSSTAPDGETDSGDFTVYAPAAKAAAARKETGWSGDFNAKDLAMGLRTVLNKDKEG